MGKGRSFRLKLALLMGLVTALLVLVPVSLLWSLTKKDRLSRLDRELFELSKPNLQRVHGRNHYRRFENSLAMTGNGEACVFWAVDAESRTLHRMSAWPADLTHDRLPRPGPMRKKKPKPKPGSAQEVLRVSEAGLATLEADGLAWRVAATTSERETLYLAYDLSVLDDELAGEEGRMFLIVLLALLVSGMVCWWLAGRATKPVRRISERLESIEAKDLGERFDAVGEDREFRQLVEVFNGMMERLQRGFEQASRFSADASHELRTPLAVMQGEVEQGLAQAVDGSDEQVRFARLLDHVAELRDITEKLLLLAGADAGTLRGGQQQVDLSALVVEMLEDLRMLADQQRIESSIEPSLMVVGDEVLMRRVLQNLASNAVRHGAQKGGIAVELKRERELVRFTISNEGPGIPSELSERIFDRFFRLDEARGRRSGGSGLGLALAREIMRAHGGDLELLPGESVMFQLSIPVLKG